MTYRAATRVISTNESYRAVAMTRGRRAAEHVTVVRSGPDTQQMRPIYPTTSVAPGPRIYSLVYLGIMGPQDGVNLVLEVMAELVHRRGRRDVHATLLGFGDCYSALRAQSTRMELDDWCTFTGRADRAMIAEHLSRADVGLCPDPKTPLNDVSTMNKTMEYMAYALPSVSFDLLETRVSGGDSVLYVESENVQAFADEVERLLDDAELRVRLGLAARTRVAEELDWVPQAANYVRVYDDLCERNGEQETLPRVRAINPSLDPQGRTYVDLDDEEELARFVRDRTPRPAVAPSESALGSTDGWASVPSPIIQLAPMPAEVSPERASG
jgi:glycosyltransferase involved in cell wall biosynthesis